MNNQSLSFFFSPANADVQVVKINNDPWFVAKHICQILELQSPYKATKNLDADEKLIEPLFLSGQRRATTLINESGLYTLLMRSNKPQAKPFRKWVTSEVLPSIRKTGHYNAPLQNQQNSKRNHNRLTEKRTVEILSLIAEIDNLDLRLKLRDAILNKS